MMDAIYVIIKETGEYSDRDVEAIGYVLTEDEARAAVERADIEKMMPQPQYFQCLPIYEWMIDGVIVSSSGNGARFTRVPDADAHEQENNRRRAIYEQQCFDLGHVDPGGCDRHATYSYQRVPMVRPAT
jgi:hypothetical protein